MTRAELIFPVIIFVVVVTFAGGGYFIGDYSWGVIAFPLGAAIVICVLCAIEIARLLSSRRVSASETPPAGGDNMPMSASGFAWIFILPLFLYGLGFVAGPAVYLLACLRANRFSWELSAGIAMASLVMTWGFFIHVMGVLLPLMPLWWS